MKIIDPLLEQPRKSAAALVGALPQGPIAPAQPVVEGAPGYEDKLKADFRLFLILVWRHLLGVDPSPIMLDMAYWLQHGPDRAVIEAFRGFSKSWITGAYCLWRLYCNPDDKVLVVSGAATKAKELVNWCLMLVLTWPLLKHLKPRPDQRSSAVAFDVGPCKPTQAPSFKAIGITGQIVGSRANVIVGDDIETQNNSITPGMRDSIKEAVKEFDSVIIPEPGSVIKYLGTPHDVDSLYNELPKRGYTVRIWPARYPDQDRIKRYKGRLAPYVLKQLAKLGPSAVGRTTMPERFPDEDLAKRELSIGRSTFDLQFMLDTSGANKDTYPLKMHDLLVASLDPRRGPETITWTNDPEHRIRDVINGGFEGDYLHAGLMAQDVVRVKYNTVVGFVDPSGRGKDETAMCVVAELNGMIFFLHLWASKEGYTPKTLARIASVCVVYGIHELLVEDNFGDGMFASLLGPVLAKAWELANKGRRADDQGGTNLQSVKSSNQMAKELRILAVLEPVTQQHRLVVDRSVLAYDDDSVRAMDGEDTKFRYSWMHQYSRLTRVRDSLVHDDRLESLAGAVGFFAGILGVDPAVVAKEGARDREDEEWAKIHGELEEDEMGLLGPRTPSLRPEGVGPTRR